MPIITTIVDCSSIVEELLAIFGDLFDNESNRRHLAESLTGWMMVENKIASGIDRERVATTDHMTLSR